MIDETPFRTEWAPVFFWSPPQTMPTLLVVGLLSLAIAMPAR